MRAVCERRKRDERLDGPSGLIPVVTSMGEHMGSSHIHVGLLGMRTSFTDDGDPPIEPRMVFILVQVSIICRLFRPPESTTAPVSERIQSIGG